jgi:hypothetical protein
MVKFQRFQVFVERVRNSTQDNGLRVFNLLLGEERVALALMAAIRAITRSRPLDACAGRDFEIAEAAL